MKATHIFFAIATTHSMKNKEDVDKITLGINNTVRGYGLDSKYIFCIFVLQQGRY
jgi:hypothetical protein